MGGSFELPLPVAISVVDATKTTVTRNEIKFMLAYPTNLGRG